MTDWVVDSSIALAWALPDETSKEADRFLSRISIRSILWVPALRWYEIANALLMAQRRKRLGEAERMRLMELYRRLPIRTDMALDSDILWRLHTLAIEYNLSAYDAAYLELAQRRGLGLATVDRTLRFAAQRAGIKVTSQG
ncbi:MAG TPA: type II toxin-antitoxin system VapC family toxin [Thermodesulfobacteriota bacterium]|nr:type II toxin-antitoxin system VapC family toxin [Thermodesulfobacteriota bacterium]